MRVFEERHFYRGGGSLPELERMAAERAPDVYQAMWGVNEWTVTGSLRGWDVRPRLPEIDVPTLVVRGRHDLSTESISRTLVEGIPHAREVVLEDSSHTPVLEETERYLAIVGGFLRDVEAGSGYL
jgi:pimeloyl-ACP methyl ester carboxylesterase